MTHDEEARVIEQLRVVTNPVRFRILSLLSEKGDVRVGQIGTTIELTQPLATYHLKLLILTGIIRSTRRGRNVFCSLSRVGKAIVRSRNAIAILNKNREL